MGKHRRRGRPVEYPDSPLHEYWRKQKRRLKEEEKQSSESLDSIPSDETEKVVEVSKENEGG